MENMQEKLRKAILENPDLDIKIFVGEDCNCGDYAYQLTEIKSVRVEKLTYHNEKFYDEDNMSDYLYDLLECGQSKEELEAEIDSHMKQIPWESAICIYID